MLVDEKEIAHLIGLYWDTAKWTNWTELAAHAIVEEMQKKVVCSSAAFVSEIGDAGPAPITGIALSDWPDKEGRAQTLRVPGYLFSDIELRVYVVRED